MLIRRNKMSDIVIPDIMRYRCPVCGSVPVLTTTDLESETGKVMKNNTARLVVTCSNEDPDGCIMRFHYPLDHWIKIYNITMNRWSNPKDSHERCKMRSAKCEVQAQN